MTGLMRNTVPSASRYSLHTSLASSTSTSFGMCAASDAPSFTYVLARFRVRRSRLLGLGNGRAVAQSQSPPRAELCIRAQPVAGSGRELWLRCGSGFGPRAALLGAFRAFLRRIGRIAGFVLECENSSHPFERF